MVGSKRETPAMRKLYAVYDAIDAQNFKLAVKLCSKKDLSTSVVAQGLKAYALVNLSRRLEALEICERLWEKEVSASENRSDDDKNTAKGKVSDQDTEQDGSLSTLGLVYTNTGLDTRALKCAEIANSRSLDKDSHMNVFFACIAVGDYDKMQKMAMKLYTLCKDSNYLGWAATTALLHCVRNDDPQPQNIEVCKKKLAFAEMLVLKRLNVPSKSPIKKAFLKGALLTTLRLEIFVLQRKFKEALDLLELRKNESCAMINDDSFNNLEDEQKHVAAANVMVRSHVYLWEAEIKQESGDTFGAANTFKHLLTDFDGDDWRNWSGCLENALQGAWVKEDGSQNSVLNEHKLLETEIELLEFIQLIQEKAKLKRGPLLAAISLRYRVMLMLLAYETFLQYSGKPGLEHGRINTAIKNFTESLCHYIQIFSSKPCCFGDVRNFLLAFVKSNLQLPKGKNRQIPPVPPSATHIFVKRLGVPLHEERLLAEQSRRWDTELYSDLCSKDESREALINFIENQLKEIQSKANSTTKEHLIALRSQTCLQQMLRYIGYHESKTDGELWKHVQANVSLYKDTLFIDQEGTGGDKEIKQGDDLLLLTAHIMIDIADRYLEKVPPSEETKDESLNCRRTILLQVASLLEYGVLQSPYSFQIRIALIEVYAQVGGFLPLVMHYNKLEIKNIQLDSMSYLVLGHALRLGFYEEARQAATSIVDFWWGSHKTNPRYIKKSFEYSNFPKAAQLCRLNRLQHESHQLIVAAVVRHHLTRLLDHNASWDKAVEYLHYEYFGYNKRYTKRSGDTNNRKSGIKTKSRGDTKTTNDSSSGEEMPWNPLPLSEVNKLDIRKLVLNYDFNTPVSWDMPIGNGAKLGRQRIGSDWIAPTYARQCNGSQSYKMAWMNTSKSWLDMHVHLSLHLVVMNGPLNTAEKADSLRRNIPVIRSGFLQTGLISLKALDLQSANLKQCIWQSLFDTVEISVNVLNVFESSKPDESDVFLLHIQMEGLNSKLEKILEKLPVEQAASSGNVLDANRLVETSMAISHAFMWLVSFVRCWTSIIPKPKKKKGKPSSEGSQVDKTTIQSDLVTAVLKLIKIFKTMNEHFSAMRPALASSEACEPFVDHLRSETKKNLKGLIPFDVEQTMIMAVLKSYEKSFLNLSVITLQYISFLKESKFV